MKLLLKTLTVIISFTFIISCNTTDPPPLPPDETKPTLTLELDDVSCTEAWLQLTTKDLELPAELTLKQYNPTGDSVAQVFNLSSLDTLLYIDSLLPNQTYNYQLSGIWHPVSGNQQQVSSNKLTSTTMDTTSHNFTWQTFTFGEHSNSILRDVAIIDENNIWAVGEIYMNDSLGNPDPNAYNAIHWNGNDWIPKKINVLFRGYIITPPLEGVFAFSSTDIWFVGSLPIHGDGTDWTLYDLRTTVDLNLSLSKVWGSSSDDIYFVGRAGSIAHYNGSTWTKIESGTTVDLLDVWGNTDGTVWTCGYNPSYSLTVLLKINNNSVKKLYEGSPNEKNNNMCIGPLSGGWTNSKYFTYLLNWGKLYRQDNKDTLDLKELSVPLFYDVAFAISANDKNDIYVSGESGMFGHFNGVRFYDLPDLRKGSIQYLGNNIKNDLFIAVGWDYSFILTKAIITIGTRN